MGWLNVYLLYRWEGKNENEVGRCKETGKIHVTVNHKYYRPTEVVRKCSLLALQMNNPITQPINCCIWPAVCENGLIALLLAAFRAQISLFVGPFTASYLGTGSTAREEWVCLVTGTLLCFSHPLWTGEGMLQGVRYHLMGNKTKCKPTGPKGVCGHLSSSCKESRGRWALVGLVSKVPPFVSPWQCFNSIQWSSPVQLRSLQLCVPQNASFRSAHVLCFLRCFAESHSVNAHLQNTSLLSGMPQWSLLWVLN